MAVIHFLDRQKLAASEGKIRTFSGLNGANEEQSQLAGSLIRSQSTVCTENNEAVRHFALMIAGKLLNDPQLNQAAPFIVDKIIRMLMIESVNR